MVIPPSTPWASDPQLSAVCAFPDCISKLSVASGQDLQPLIPRKVNHPPSWDVLHHFLRTDSLKEKLGILTA